MTISSQSILLVGNLTNKFTLDFVNYLILNGSTNLHVLWHVFNREDCIPNNLLNSNIHIFYGSAKNTILLQKIINKKKIETVFYFNYPSKNETLNDGKAVLSSAKSVLATLTQFLEGFRNCTISLPKLVSVFFCGNNISLLSDGHISGTFKAKTIDEANFCNSVALLHSYAISYRLNIQVANFSLETSENVSSSKNAFEFLFQINNQESDVGAKVYKFNISTDNLNSINSDNKNTAAKFLIYGSESVFAKKFISLLKEQNILYLHSNLRPEAEDKSKLLEEIIDVAPSHIVYLPQCLSTGEGVDVYNECGSQNVLKNSRDNLFGPLNIANICTKLGGIHFTYFGAESLQTLKELLDTEEQSDKNITQIDGLEDSYTVAKRFTNLSFKFFEDSVLNFCVNINLNNKPQQFIKYANTLLESTLSFKKGDYLLGEE